MQTKGQTWHTRRIPGAPRWTPVLAALLIALVALVAFGGMTSATAAAAAKHTTHTSKKVKPTPTPAFALSFSCAQGVSWGSGASATVCVQTVAGAKLTITVKACGKMVSDPGLSGTATADSSGAWAWSYSPSPRCATQLATVKATSGGKSVTKSKSFKLQNLGVNTSPTIPAVPTA